MSSVAAMALSLLRYTYQRDVDTSLYHLLKQRVKNERERSMTISIAPEYGDCLPENLLIEILLWLPVKELLQYKSVCKSWYAIISSPRFAAKHLKNNPNNNESCLLVQYHVSHGELMLVELLVDETPRVLAYEALYEPAKGAQVCGPCDGLYYLCHYDFRALWNPTINELRRLPLITKPDPPANTIYSNNGVFSFGFDPVTRDYKVVAIADYWSTNDETIMYPPPVHVYSLRTDSWKYCGDLAQRYYLDNNLCYIFVNGCCFWLGSTPDGDENYRELIISFDMVSDSFQEIHVPNYEQPASNKLGMYDDSLAFFSIHEDEGNLGIWTLNHGIWTKKFCIGPIPDVLNPVGHWKKDKVILECQGHKLVLCDPDTHEIKDLDFQVDHRCEGIFAYMESLVSIKDKNKSREEEELEVDIDQV